VLVLVTVLVLDLCLPRQHKVLVSECAHRMTHTHVVQHTRRYWVGRLENMVRHKSIVDILFRSECQLVRGVTCFGMVSSHGFKHSGNASQHTNVYVESESERETAFTRSIVVQLQPTDVWPLVSWHYSCYPPVSAWPS
jgi:hypothetical protein